MDCSRSVTTNARLTVNRFTPTSDNLNIVIEYSKKIFEDFKKSVPVSKIVEDFLRHFAERIDQMNVVLTNVIFNVCKLSSTALVFLEVPDISQVEILIEKVFENENENEERKNEYFFPKYFNNLVQFLILVASSKWRNLSNECRFDSYFSKLMSLLSESSEINLRRLSIHVRLSLIDTITTDFENITDEQQEVVNKYATDVLSKSFRDSKREIWDLCLDRLSEWIMRGPPFLDDKYLRFVIYSLKDKSAKIVQHALKISITLMDNELCRPHLKTFVKLLVLCLAFIQTSDFKDFPLICDCCKSLYKYTKWPNCSIPINFNELIWDRVFDFSKRDMVQTVIEVFQEAVLCHESETQNVLEIVRFLSGRDVVHIKLFVEASIDNCSLITDWQLLARVLQMNIAVVTEAEKEILLAIILAAAEHIVAKDSLHIPENASDQSDEINLRAELTNAFKPIVATEICNSKRLKPRLSLCIQLMKYFDLNAISERTLKQVITSCTFMLMEYDLDLVQMKMIVALLAEILEKCTQPGILNLCKSIVERFQTFVQEECDKHFGNREGQSEAQPVWGTDKALMALNALSSILPLNKRYGYELPLQLLWTNAAEMGIVKEMSVVVAVNYAKYIMKHHESPFTNKEETQMLARDSRKLEDLRPDFQDIYNMIAIFFDVLCAEFQRRLGQLVFHGICDCIVRLSEIHETLVPMFFTERRIGLMATYITAVLPSSTKQDNLPKVVVPVSEKADIVEQYLQLIVRKILPFLSFANDVLIAFCEGTDVLELPLKFFVLAMCKKTDVEKMAKWFVTFFIEQFEEAGTEELFADVVAHAKVLSNLLHPLKEEVSGVIRRIHFLGIDYSVNQSYRKRIRFLYPLAEFSRCLSKTDKLDVLKHLSEKPLTNRFDTKHYVNSMSKINLPKNVLAANAQESASGGVSEDDAIPKEVNIDEDRKEVRLVDVVEEIVDNGAVEKVENTV